MNWYKKSKKNECTGYIGVRLDNKISKKIQEWGENNISEEDLYYKQKEQGKKLSFGRELDTHITVIYGICTDDAEIIKEIIKKEKPVKATLKTISFFKKDPDYDVVMVKAESPDLEKLNHKIKQILNVETNYLEYRPHCTIAYVKKGKAFKYSGNNVFEGTKLIFDEVVFSPGDDDETIVKFKK